MSQHPAVDELAMSMFAAPADYWRARAERAEAGLVAAANGAIAALSLPGAPTRSEREEIIASLRAAIALHDGREVQAVPQGCVDVRGVLNGVIGEAVEGSPVGASVAELQAVDRAFVRLLAAGREMLRIERTQGVSDEEAEAAIEQLDAAVSGHESAVAPAPAAQGGEAVIYYAANVELGGDFNHIPISMFDQPAIFLSREKAEQFCSFANGTGSRHEARSLALKSIALPAAASGLAEAECIAIYDAVTRSNLTRDVKTDERKVAVVRGAQ